MRYKSISPVIHGTLYALFSRTRSSDASENTYKAMFESTTMTSGLYFVVLINIAIAWLGILFYRYVVLRQVGLLSPEELCLLRKYPPVRSAQSYTPEESFVRSAPPMRWTGWRTFFTASDEALSRDAQVYLLFQRACIATTAVCAVVSFVVLLPSYWFGGELHPSSTDNSPMTLATMLRSDRGVFDRFTSHNLPKHSPLVILQLPVLAVAAFCVVLLYTVVQAGAGDHRSLEDWLRHPAQGKESSREHSLSYEDVNSTLDLPRSTADMSLASDRKASRRLDFGASVDSEKPLLASQEAARKEEDWTSYGAIATRSALDDGSCGRNESFDYSSDTGADSLNAPSSPLPPISPISGIRRHHGWTLFARGIPRDVESRSELTSLLSAIYPQQIRSVELVCKGRMSEARLLRALSTARNRLDYLREAADVDSLKLPFDDVAMSDSAADQESNSLAYRGEAESSRVESNLGNDSTRDGGILQHALILPRTLKDQCLYWLFGRRRNRDCLVSELKSEISSLERDLASRKQEPVRDFRGCAFLTVRSSATAYSLLHEFPLEVRTFRTRDIDAGTGKRMCRECSTSQLSSFQSSPVAPRPDAVFSSFGVQKLYRAIVIFLPRFIKNRVMCSRFLAPRTLTEENATHDRLMSQRTSSGRFTRESAVARLRTMKAERAPKSGDIIWNNIGISFFERTCRELFVQVLVFALLILFTSPVAMLTALRLVFAEVALFSDLGHSPNGTTLVNNFTSSRFSTGLVHTSLSRIAGIKANGFTPAPNSTVQDNAVDDISNSLMDMLPSFFKSNSLLRSVLLAYIPVLLLAVVFSVVPTVLRAISNLEGYSTHSAKEMSVFRKTAFYYVMNAVVLPSLALNTASEFLAMIYKQSEGGANVYNALPILQRVFSGDIAFFLCNYLVQLALTGSVFWLMRLPASFSMMVRRRMALTPLEVAEAKCTGIFDFPRHYAYSVTVLSMCLLFGFMAPLIWGFALMYYICKHAVDTYLIRYVHPRSHIDGRLPRLGANFVLTWTCVSQIFLAIIFHLQGWISVGIVTVVLCVLTLVACLSAGPYVGYRLLSIIPQVRDVVVYRLLNDRHGWFRASAQGVSTTSSSSSSLHETVESDALLSRVESRNRYTTTDGDEADKDIECSDRDSNDQDGVEAVGALADSELEEGYGHSLGPVMR